MPDPKPDSNLVPVFHTTDRGLLPLATMALEEAGIEHTVRHPHISGVIVGERSELSSAGPADESALEVVVAAEDEARARELLADLAQSGPGTSMPPPRAEALGGWPASPPPAGAEVLVVDAQTGATLAHLSDDQLAWLSRHLELESSVDTDYYLDRGTLEMLEQAGASPDLLATLREALGAREGMDVRWGPRRS